jgi:hypothetical protein
VSEHADILARLTGAGPLLREVRQSLMRQTPELKQRWFQAPGCDLFLWYHHLRGLCHVQLTLPDRRALDWFDDQPLRTSRLAAFGIPHHTDDPSRLVHDRAPDAQTLAQARALLSRATVDDVTLALIRKRLGF